MCLFNSKYLKMTRIAVAKGDGIGPEIMDATLAIIKAAGA
ncbi:isocitrate dehydrogenase [Alkalitalea saponilacus]|uniref:Isocitrate dehydrogenase n=1 Tax=Alkalitalea saponilacus TaxID=889453 RepID=A0A1T5D3Q9_9BACT|nr:isocitrate dehydrogenase [Alkalitalea saponilacus]